MTSLNDLQRLLERIDGKGYPQYKQIKGEWQGDHYRLVIDHVQGDPFANASKLRILAPYDFCKIPEDAMSSSSRKIALRDYLTRRFFQASKRFSKTRGTGKSGLMTIDQPGQQILQKTSCLLQPDYVEIRFIVGLPADGRRIRGFDASDMLLDDLNQAVHEAITHQSMDHEELMTHVKTYEDADALRDSLKGQNLVAFIANQSMLARESGISDLPLMDGIAFQSPSSLEVTLDRPNDGPIKGMGIPEGITIIAGGGYHGKSTLLSSLERGVYNHIPDDGREYVVTRQMAAKIRAEDGRSVSGVDISSFINNLPGDKDTTNFSTDNASGSTSQATNIMEAMEAGAEILLLDEDTSATNFMIRDRRMQELIATDKEPITPFIDRIGQFYEQRNISVILVMGGSGDYFEPAHQVIALDEYKPHDVTEKAKGIAQEFSSLRKKEAHEPLKESTTRIPLTGSFQGQRGKKPISIKTRKTEELNYGYETIDTYYLEQLVHPSQLRAIGQALRVIEPRLQQEQSLVEILDFIEGQIEQHGLDNLLNFPDGDLARFRPLELAATLNRCRGLKIRKS